MNGDRLDRIEKILEEMALRQQYHDEAFDRMDEGFRELRELVKQDAENIHRLALIAEAHQRRLDEIQGEQ